MSGHRQLAGRIKRLGRLLGERGGKRVPHIVTVDVNRGETPREALVAFRERWGRLPAGHGLLRVPAQPRTEADRERFKVRFAESQRRLVREARSRSAELLEGETPPLNAVAASVRSPKGTAKRNKPWKPPVT